MLGMTRMLAIIAETHGLGGVNVPGGAFCANGFGATYISAGGFDANNFGAMEWCCETACCWQVQLMLSAWSHGVVL